jgi:hypothetical protein
MVQMVLMGLQSLVMMVQMVQMGLQSLVKMVQMGLEKNNVELDSKFLNL